VVHISLELGDLNEWEHVSDQQSEATDADQHLVEAEETPWSFSRKSIGATFWQLCMDRCAQESIDDFICVADHVSPVVKRLLRRPQTNPFLTWFTYVEMSHPCMGRHTLQPMRVQVLTPEETQLYAQTHPEYRKELPLFPHTDILLRFMGVRPEQVFVVEESDYQGVNFQREYALAM
jgi:hypothetical protein